MKVYKGDLKITKYNQKEYKDLEKVTGYLYINSEVKLDAPLLKSVGSDLHINSKAKLDAPLLKSVGGYLYINSEAKLDAPLLKSVGGYLHINSEAKLDAPLLKSVGSDLHINSEAKLDAPLLKSVGGYLYINSELNPKLEKRLYGLYKKKQWYLSNTASKWLLSQKFKKAKFVINNVQFDKKLFDKVRKDKLSAKQVFVLDNIEQRRVAYELMDKTKMEKLKNYKVLDEAVDENENKMRIVSFSVDGYSEPFKYYHCICPSTGREYFVETQRETCQKAKTMSFGKQVLKFNKEY